MQDTATYWAASLTKAQITSPAKGSTLPALVQFFWTAETGATSYQVWVGNAPGTHDITYAETSGLSVWVSMPVRDGRPLYVTLWGYLGGAWTVQDSGSYTSLLDRVVMSLVLDRSGSMISNGGATALQAAVPQFVNYFTNGLDEIGLITFADNAEIDVPISTNFLSPIVTAVGNMAFAGGTFGTGAGSQPIQSTTVGPPISLADLQNNSVFVPPGSAEVKVMVYFTDGLVNTIQDTFFCPNPVLLNYGGFDTLGAQYGDIFDPNSPATIFGTATSSGFPYDNRNDKCRNSSGVFVTTFTSQQTGQQKSFLQSNITPEAQYRALYTANVMRSENPIPTYIYTIGLGSSLSSAAQTFLKELANDPTAPTHNSNQPSGQFFYISSCPSSQCTAELEQAFYTIAARLL